MTVRLCACVMLVDLYDCALLRLYACVMLVHLYDCDLLRLYACACALVVWCACTLV